MSTCANQWEVKSIHLNPPKIKSDKKSRPQVIRTTRGLKGNGRKKGVPFILHEVRVKGRQLIRQSRNSEMFYGGRRPRFIVKSQCIDQ